MGLVCGAGLCPAWDYYKGSNGGTVTLSVPPFQLAQEKGVVYINSP